MTRAELQHLIAGGILRNITTISEAEALEAAESALRELDHAGLGIQRRPGRRSETELYWVAGRARMIL
jgi:hypothetical protein